MSISAQVDTSSIDVSLDMNELRTEINEVIDEAVPDMIREIISEGHQSVLITGLIRRIQTLEDRLPEHKVVGIEDEMIHIHKRIDAVDNRLCQIENRIDELTARLVGAGCMLTGTRSQS
jgi:L-lysine 2,3-aminomutase